MLNVGIVGGAGYTGVELLRILLRHPHVHIQLITSREYRGVAVTDIYQDLRGQCDLQFVAPEMQKLLQCELVFFATPHGVAHKWIEPLCQAGVRIVDLSADFRLKDVELWQQWYGAVHQSPAWLAKAVYGLPECNRQAIKGAQLVACPGCYPTAVQLGFAPLLERDLIDPVHLIANAVSGTSGAGRKEQVDLLYAEMGENFKAYAVSGHRHLPEIEQSLRALQPATCSKPAKVTFVPHLLPLVRGMHATLYARLIDKSVDLQELYQLRYAKEPFVDVMPQDQYPQISSVRSSNVCRLSLTLPTGGDTLVIMSVIDNLVKGAAGQAVQNMNIMFGFAEHLGLL